MEAYMKVLMNCPLFAGCGEDEITSMLQCLSGKKKTCEKKEFLFSAGDTKYEMGVLLQGQVDILQEDFWGNQGILTRLAPGDIFAESFVLARVSQLPVSIMATERSHVLLLDYGRIVHSCSNACAFHERLIDNLLAIVARKNITLTRKLEHVTKRTIREKLLAFFSSRAKEEGGSNFSIPYDRQGLADYLGVDRSALSRELSNMQREGLLSYQGNRFTLLL